MARVQGRGNRGIGKQRKRKTEGGENRRSGGRGK